MLQLDAAGVRIDHVSCIHQVAMLAHQPVSAVELAAFFVCCERQDQVALGLISLAMQAQESFDQRGVGVLHVLRATPVDIAVLLNELKGIGGPIGAQRLHHVYVAEEKNGLVGGRSGSAEADNEILFAFIRAEEMDVFGRKSCIEEEAFHGRSCAGYIALRRVRCVDFDELLEDGERLRAIFSGSLWQLVLRV